MASANAHGTPLILPFIQILKRVTDKAEPCGTPALTGRVEFKDFPILTVYFLFEKLCFTASLILGMPNLVTEKIV